MTYIIVVILVIAIILAIRLVKRMAREASASSNERITKMYDEIYYEYPRHLNVNKNLKILKEKKLKERLEKIEKDRSINQ